MEKATGHSLGTELQQRIFEPLGLRDTTFDTEPQIAGPFAHGYELLGKPPLLDASAVSPSYGWAAGAIVSTVDDVARFYRALLEGKPFGERLVRSMKATVAMGPHEPSRYGLGLVSVLLPCGTAWGHDGGTIGYRTWALNSEDGRRQLVVFANLSEDSLSRAAVRALDGVLVTAYCG